MGTRRSFLKLGAAGALLLAAGGAIYRVTSATAPLQRFVLTGDAHAVLAAIAPVMLGSTLVPDQAGRGKLIEQVLERVHGAILGLPLQSQNEIGDLFGLLALAPARRWIAGIDGGWSDAQQAQVAAFLQSWRGSRFETLQGGYHALHDLFLGAWYADPASWAAIDYPGPLKELS